jgi:hypothetical protein
VNMPALRPNVKAAPSGHSNIQVTHMRHPKRRLGSIESHFARMEKCGAAIHSLEMSGLNIDVALRALSSTHVFLSPFGSSTTWTLFMLPTAVAWVLIPGYLKPLSSLAGPWRGETQSSASVAFWRSMVSDQFARLCHPCVAAQLAGISFVAHFPVNPSFTLEIDGPDVTSAGFTIGGAPPPVPLIRMHTYSPVYNLTASDFDLGWAVALRLLGQHLEVHDREFLIHGLSEPSWTNPAVLSDEVRAHIWSKLPDTVGTHADVPVQLGSMPVESEAGELCAALSVLEAHRP